MITAMLNFYDEGLVELSRVVDDIARLGATRLVAVDGAYENFPGGEPRSDFTQALAIRLATARNNIDLVLVEPARVWVGDEVAKRQFMLDLALAVTPAGEWLMVFDADYELIDLYVDVAELLSRTTDDALDITFTTAPDVPAGDHQFRMFMRATPGMRMGPNHYTYIYPDGQHSTVMARDSTIEAVWTHKIRIFHRHHLRDEARHAAQTAYYEIRDGQGLETDNR
jgi:hypothetical protein